jgi:hypothetical protein
MTQATKTGGRPLARLLCVLDRWFRAWGLVTIGLLATTALALLVDARWRFPFALAHLAALVALLPLAIALAARALLEGREHARSWPGAIGYVASRYALVVALVLVAFATIALSLANFEDGNRAVRSLANFATVAIIAVLVVRYLRSERG